jgi:hypothetical protein
LTSTSPRRTNHLRGKESNTDVAGGGGGSHLVPNSFLGLLTPFLKIHLQLCLPQKEN